MSNYDPNSFRIAVGYAESYGLQRAYEMAKTGGASEKVCSMLARWRREYRKTGRLAYCR